ncbi:hypothetical protein [Streptomyces europaeiscabiei]|nr:hypothetical protein [Streptomyces europaeiscabiei]MDX2530816.1 hypothetical protein [Streptomyces europaeiscabiei]
MQKRGTTTFGSLLKRAQIPRYLMFKLLDAYANRLADSLDRQR